MPPVAPSAMPRNNDRVPSVTMSGGNLRRAMSAALSAPPAIPMRNVAPTATDNGKPTSCHRNPNATAARPIIDPTERSIPPVTMIGVSASASRPISTLRRVISNAFPDVAKLWPASPNTMHSTRMTTTSTHSCSRMSRATSGRVSAGDNSASEWTVMRQTGEHRIGDERRQNDQTLNCLFPKGTDADVCQYRADRPEQQDADHRTRDVSPPPGDRRSADDDGRDSSKLETYAGIARNCVEANR